MPLLLDQEFLGARPGWVSLCHLPPPPSPMSSAGLRGGDGPGAWTKLTWARGCGSSPPAWVQEAPLTGVANPRGDWPEPMVGVVLDAAFSDLCPPHLPLYLCHRAGLPLCLLLGRLPSPCCCAWEWTSHGAAPDPDSVWVQECVSPETLPPVGAPRGQARAALCRPCWTTPSPSRSCFPSTFPISTESSSYRIPYSLIFDRGAQPEMGVWNLGSSRGSIWQRDLGTGEATEISRGG